MLIPIKNKLVPRPRPRPVPKPVPRSGPIPLA